MANEMDKAIAQKYLDTLDRHEASWVKTGTFTVEGMTLTNGNYTLSFDVEFCKSLTPEERDSGFGRILMAFGMRWANDVVDICNRVLSGEPEWEVKGYESTSDATHCKM